MLSDAVKQSIQSAFSQLLKRKQLQTRPGQKRMIAEIARTLAGVERDEEGRRTAAEPGVCVVEAGTGTGKTLAYLVSALPVAQALNKKLIVSTATIALQEQVLHKDIPDLLTNSDLQFSYMLAKGRGRYLCLAKLDNALRANGSSAAMRDLFKVELQDPADLDRALYERMLEVLGRGEWQGDRDEWPQAIEDEQWRPVAVEAGQCSGSRCSYFANCCYFKSREGLLKADCIVANHDLVLSDLALGGGVILPAPGDSIYVFDEAHQLPGKSLSHFSHQLRLGGTAKWLEQFAGILTRLQQEVAAPNRFTGMVEEAAQLAQRTRNLLNERLVMVRDYEGKTESASADGTTRQYVFARGVVDDPLRETFDALAVEFTELASRLARINELLRTAMETEGAEIERQQAEQWFPLFGSAQIRVEAAARCCLHFSRADAEHAVPEARWLGFREYGNEVEITVAASPVLAAGSLQEYLWHECFAAVLTSATLTTLGSFDFLRKRCGLPDGSHYHAIQSPFSHREAAVLQVPRRGFDPSNVTGHTQAITELLPTLLENERGALVLFSSRRQLLDVLQGLPSDFRELVLAQDDYPKHELLRLHRAAVDAGGNSVIFGLASLAEGIDLPGEYCTHVVIAKIPFPVPNDPVDATLGDWVKLQGGNPFQEISVPEACLRLIQASGRLLRQESDTGTITILDERLLTRGYGKDILASLPPYQRKTL
ncbi:MAG TPA: ATP-dependent DNA helicase DinG [Candidatus Acidoferrum sp.]|nr:ATP-dependent DNA helicase DinG [Candidatus Acidoferrum sp.]